MPTITIRVSAAERADLESAAQRSGQNLSDYVREALDLRRDGLSVNALHNTVTAYERRIARLEEMAGVAIDEGMIERGAAALDYGLGDDYSGRYAEAEAVLRAALNVRA